MLDFLLLTPEPLSLDSISAQLKEKGWDVGRARHDRLVVSHDMEDYVAIEEADDVRREFSKDEWEKVVTRIPSPSILYFKYLSRSLVHLVLKDIVRPGMLIDENDQLLDASAFSE
jgi:hypothetical protein